MDCPNRICKFNNMSGKTHCEMCGTLLPEAMVSNIDSSPLAVPHLSRFGILHVSLGDPGQAINRQ